MTDLYDSKETHESYGMIGVSRFSCSPGISLFGSSIKHSNAISITIRAAEVCRHLNRDWYHGLDEIIEVELSPTQFAEMITSLNVGDGVPCTIRHINLNRKENPPEVKQRQIFEDEFKNDIKELEKICSEDVKEIDKILNKKGTITVKERKEAWNKVLKVFNKIGDHIPFLQKQFNEAMDKTVLEAKGEVDAFVTNKVTSLGIKGLEQEMLKLGEGK